MSAFVIYYPHHIMWTCRYNKQYFNLFLNSFNKYLMGVFLFFWGMLFFVISLAITLNENPDAGFVQQLKKANPDPQWESKVALYRMTKRCCFIGRYLEEVEDPPETCCMFRICTRNNIFYEKCDDFSGGGIMEQSGFYITVTHISLGCLLILLLVEVVCGVIVLIDMHKEKQKEEYGEY